MLPGSVHEARRGDGLVTMASVLGCTEFLFPFLLLLSRRAKRSSGVLTIAASVALVGHVVDVFWLADPSPGLVGVAAAALPCALLFASVARAMAHGPLYPANDPRAGETMELVS